MRDVWRGCGEHVRGRRGRPDRVRVLRGGRPVPARHPAPHDDGGLRRQPLSLLDAVSRSVPLPTVQSGAATGRSAHSGPQGDLLPSRTGLHGNDACFILR